MKKILFAIITLGLLLAGFIFYRLRFYSIEESEKTLSFNEWYKDNSRSDEARDDFHTYQVASPLFEIDRIYRSMEGPLAAKEFYLAPNLLALACEVMAPELLWITGYKVELLDEHGKPMPDEFMCHNNVNLGRNNVLPWYTRTMGTDKRLFTLTEGHTELHLPAGFGIPVLSDQALRVDFQVLNHNLEAASLKIRQVVTLFYRKDAECGGKMKALYQQAVFVTKQVSGAPGGYDEPVSAAAGALQAGGIGSGRPCCNRTLYDSLVYDPYRDSYDRKYTGHWVIADTAEELKTDVTRMLALRQDCRAHFFSSHVHPFCEQLQFSDETTGESIYTAEIENFSRKIGVASIPFKASAEGIRLYKDHRYALKCRYDKKYPGRHTAMATMFIYFEEP